MNLIYCLSTFYTTKINYTKEIIMISEKRDFNKEAAAWDEKPARIKMAESVSVSPLIQAPVKKTWCAAEPAELNVENLAGVDMGTPLIVTRMEYCVLAVSPPI